MKIDKGAILEKLNVQEDDILIITIDPDFCPIEYAQQITDRIKECFPNNKIICKIKGVDIEIEVEDNDINKKTS